MNTAKLFCIRVHNRTRSCVLMRQFANGVWTFPCLAIPKEDDPIKHLDRMLTQIAGNFELVSAVNILEHEKVVALSNSKYISSIYDINYKGVVKPGLPHGDVQYEAGKWMMIDALTREKNLNVPTMTFAETMGKEQCLR